MPQRLFNVILYTIIFFAGFYLARLFLSPAQYLENLSATLTTLCAFALVFLAYYFSVQSSAHRQEQHELLLHMHKESLRPSLHAQLRPCADKPNLIELVLNNQGKGFAERIHTTITASPNASTPATEAFIAALQPLSALANGLDGLAEGESYTGVFTDIFALLERFAPAPINGILVIQTKCLDTLGLPHQSESHIDLAAFAAQLPDIPTSQPPVKSHKKLLY